MPQQGSGMQPVIPPSRNSGCWKGVAIGCGALFLAGVIGIAGLVFFVFSVIKSNYVFTEAMRRAQANPQVTERLGTPIEAGWLVSGNVNVKNETGEAHLSIPIHGPRGGAMLYVDAFKKSNNWSYTRLDVEGGGSPIDLLK